MTTTAAPKKDKNTSKALIVFRFAFAWIPKSFQSYRGGSEAQDLFCLTSTVFDEGIHAKLA